MSVAATTAGCGFCGVTEPDRDGNRDPLEHADCPLHSGGAEAYRDGDGALICPRCASDVLEGAARAAVKAPKLRAVELADERWPEPGDGGYPGPIRLHCHECGEPLA